MYIPLVNRNLPVPVARSMQKAVELKKAAFWVNMGLAMGASLRAKRANMLW